MKEIIIKFLFMLPVNIIGSFALIGIEDVFEIDIYNVVFIIWGLFCGLNTDRINRLYKLNIREDDN